MQPRIIAKIDRIRHYLSLLDTLAPDCEEKIFDPIYQGALLHYLYRMADSVVSLAEMVCKHNRISTPNSYYEAIDLLGERGIIPADFAYDFAKIASFRNFLAHDYERLDPVLICRSVLDKRGQVWRFLELIEDSLKPS